MHDKPLTQMYVKGHLPQQQVMQANDDDPMMAIAGSHKLGIQHDMVVSDSPCAEAFCFGKRKSYSITTFDGSTWKRAFVVKEESTSMGRCCCNPYHKMKLHVCDPTGKEVFVMDRPFKCLAQCPTLTPCCQQESTLYRGDNPRDSSAIIGRSKESLCRGIFTIFTPTVEVRLGVTNTAFAVVEGPLCCFGGLTEMCFDQPFRVSRRKGKSGDVGEIVKEKLEGDPSKGDTDFFTLTFKDPSLDSTQKMMLLSTVLLLDYMFLEQNQPVECNCCLLGFVCFHCYMCGALQPCKCFRGQKIYPMFNPELCNCGGCLCSCDCDDFGS